MKKIISIIPHLTIVLAAMFITFWILDGINPLMDFLSNDISHTLLIIFCILSMITSIFTVALDRKLDKKQNEIL